MVLIANDRKKIAVPEGFSWRHMENYVRHGKRDEDLVVSSAEILDNVSGDRASSVCLVKFCKTPPLISRGKNKGRYNWGRRDKSKDGSATISRPEFEAWVLKWHEETGLCPHCFGSGELICRVSIHGKETKPCHYCVDSKASV